jgi:hypothetical protein
MYPDSLVSCGRLSPHRLRRVIRGDLPMRATIVVRLAIVLALVTTPSIARAQSPRYEKIHEGRRRPWYAPPDQYSRHKADIAALYDHAGKAFDKL